MTMAEVAHGPRYRVQAVVKATALLGAFSEPPHRFTLTELSQRTQQSKNQAFRLLQTLLETGFVRLEPGSKVYCLGPAAYRLLGAVQLGDELVLAADQTLDWVRDETGETINLIARDGPDAAVCVAKRESARRLQITAQLGKRFTLHAGASPKLLLAFSPDDRIDAYLARHQPLRALTPYTITEAHQLWDEIRRIREEGFATSDEDLDLGACAVAAPIHDRSGEVVAGISLAMPAARFGPLERDRFRSIALEAGRRISTVLGYDAGRHTDPVAAGVSGT